ncbi:MAG: discoidin domain-containing protein [Armatimonadetes bacterium]|nr:discoidin domain-containing protein [Armatimonadota bacterium]
MRARTRAGERHPEPRPAPEHITRGWGLAVSQSVFVLLTTGVALAMWPDRAGRSEAAPPPSPSSREDACARPIFQERMGLFIHWAGPAPGRGTGILFSDGRLAQTIDEFAEAVDVPRVCDEIAALGFDHVVLTDFHGLGTMLHPSEASERWRGPGFASRRDVVGEMIAGLKAREIGAVLFTHPLDGHDFSDEQQERLGWNDPEGDYRRWNDFINEAYAELTDRYGKDLIGMGFDSEFSLSGHEAWRGKLDRLRLRETILSRRPDLPLMALAGPNETCELGMKEIWRPSWFDPWMTRAEDDYDVETWPAYRRGVGIVQGHHWATITPPAGGRARLTAEQMFRYTVLQAGTATEGPGVCWAASPYADGLWEKDVREAFAGLAAHIAPVGESLRDVYASRAYPTPEGSTLAGLRHGVVATRRIDDAVEYLHVLNPPPGRALELPAPADGKRFTAAALLPDATPVDLTQDDTGLRLALRGGQVWRPLNTVIRLQVDPATIASRNLALHRPVLASSSIERDPAWPPRSDWNRIRLVDGQTRVTPAPQEWSTGNAGWSSARLEHDREEHVSVDLGSRLLIGSVRLYPRDDGEHAGHGFPAAVKIQLSLDGHTWTTVAERADCPLPQGPQSFAFAPQRARWVRVLATRLRANPADQGRYSFQLAELEVLAPGR